MPKVSGLRPFDDEPAAPNSANDGRVQTREFAPNNPRLRPTATPVDTFVRPAKAPIDNDLERLSSALSAFSPALEKYGMAVQNENVRKKHDPVSAEFNELVSTKGAAWVRDDIKANPDGRAATLVRGEKESELFGTKAAEDFMARTVEAYGVEANKDGFDFKAFRQKAIADELATHQGRGERFTNSFLESVSPKLTALEGAQVKHNIEKRSSEVAQAAGSTLTNIIDNGVLEKKSYGDIAKTVRKEIAGNQRLNILSPEKQEQELLAIIQQRAEKGEVDIVKALLDEPGANGISLSASRQFAPNASALIKTADAAKRKIDNDGSFTQLNDLSEAARNGTLDEKTLTEAQAKNTALTPQHASSLLERSKAARERIIKESHEREVTLQRERAADDNSNSRKIAGITAMNEGRLHELGFQNVIDEKGNTSTLTPEQVRKAAVENTLELSAAQAARNKETKEQTFARELKVFRDNGQAHPTWKATLESGLASISVVSASGEKLPPVYEETMRMYGELKQKAPQLIARMLPAGEINKLEAIHLATTGMGLDPAKVAFQASEYIRTGQRSSVTPEVLKSATKDFSSSSNFGTVELDISDRAGLFKAVGLSDKAAAEAAVKSYKLSHQEIGGRWVDLSDRSIPNNAKQLMELKLDDYANKYAKSEGLSRSDIVVGEAGDGTGGWAIYNKATGSLVDQPEGRTFTTADIIQLDKDRLALKADKAAGKQEVRQNAEKAARAGGKVPDGPIGSDPAKAAKVDELRKQRRTPAPATPSIFSGTATEADVPAVPKPLFDPRERTGGGG